MYTNYSTYRQNNYNNFNNSFMGRPRAQTLETVLREFKNGINLNTTTVAILPKDLYKDQKDIEQVTLECVRPKGANYQNDRELKISLAIKNKQLSSNIEAPLQKGSLQDIRDYLTGKNIESNLKTTIIDLKKSALEDLKY